MKTKACQELLNIEIISSAFQNKREDLTNQIISCFYSCYQSLFVQWAKITYRRYPVDLIESLAQDAFTDGVLKLKESAVSDKLYQSNANIKTILFHFCRNILLGNLSHEKRLADKNKKLAPFISNEYTSDTGEPESEEGEILQENMMLALAKMSAADRQIIQWRHLEEKSNDEIAKILAITTESATNRIYRCMQRLRKLVDEIGER